MLEYDSTILFVTICGCLKVPKKGIDSFTSKCFERWNGFRRMQITLLHTPAIARNISNREIIKKVVKYKVKKLVAIHFGKHVFLVCGEKQ